jgi:hypothetical protein
MRFTPTKRSLQLRFFYFEQNILKIQYFLLSYLSNINYKNFKMRKINKEIFDRLQIGNMVFKYPVTKGTIENVFYPNIDRDYPKIDRDCPKIDIDFKEYWIIEKHNGEIRLYDEPPKFTHENLDKVKNLNESDLIDGTWWVRF